MNEIMEILTPALGEELARDIVLHRKGLKCPLTARGARSLLKQYEMTGNAITAAEEHLNRGWQGFKAEWMMRPSTFYDQRNPTAAPRSANYGNPEPPLPVREKTSEEKERVRLAAEMFKQTALARTVQ